MPLIKHIKLEHFDGKHLHICKQCGQIFIEESKYKKHCKGPICKGSCDKCDMKFKNHRKLEQHKLQVHGDHFRQKSDKSPITCEKCGKLFKFKANFEKHMISHNEATIVCDQCGKLFKSEKYLQEHKITHSAKTIKCIFDNCDYMFATEGKLRAHVRQTHRKKKTQKFYCDECAKVCKSTAKLKEHIRVVHRGERPFKCDKCDFDAAYRQTLREHIETIHEGVMFHCEVPGCGKQMNRKANINKHMKTAHGIPLPNERKPPKQKKYIDET